jgi:hypothetical protein
VESDSTANDVFYQVLWPSGVEGGPYSLQSVKIQTFNHPDYLQGSFVRFFVQPYVKDGQIAGGGIGHFSKVGDNSFVPVDLLSLQAATLYAHFEHLHQLDEQMGVSGQLNWPLNVGLNSKVAGTVGLVLNNALYDGRLDTLFFVPYSNDRLPLTFNAGIVAHEHFHKIFQVYVLGGRSRSGLLDCAEGEVEGEVSQMHNLSYQSSSYESSSYESSSYEPIYNLSFGPISTQSSDALDIATYNDFVLRGLNEGLADFWGWLYSGESAYFGRSLNEAENNRRRLDLGVDRLPGAGFWQLGLQSFSQNNNSAAMRTHFAYELGTYYARFLYSLVNDSDLSLDPDTLAKAVVSTLPLLRRSLVVAAQEKQIISIDTFPKALMAKLPNVSLATCRKFSSFLGGGSASIGGDHTELGSACLGKLK